MNPLFDPGDKNSLSVNEQIEVLKAINEEDYGTKETEIEALSFPEYYQ